MFFLRRNVVLKGNQISDVKLSKGKQDNNLMGSIQSNASTGPGSFLKSNLTVKNSHLP